MCPKQRNSTIGSNPIFFKIAYFFSGFPSFPVCLNPGFIMAKLAINQNKNNKTKYQRTVEGTVFPPLGTV